VAYYPGETNVRMADAIVINKIDSADPAAVDLVRANLHRVNPDAVVIDAASPASCDRPDLVRGKRVLVVEDGPTVTHGEMKFGAGTVVARRFGAREIVDPRPYAVGRLASTYAKYPGIGTVLPAMGYGEEQTRDLEATIAATPCDTVIVGTPIDLARIITIRQPSVRVRYDLQEIGRPDLADVLTPLVARVGVV
jgi:predicted GTPase